MRVLGSFVVAVVLAAPVFAQQSVPIRGIVTLVEQGVARDASYGSFELVLHNEMGREGNADFDDWGDGHIRVEVVGGRFEASIPRYSSFLRIGRMTLEGSLARSAAEWPNVPTDGALAIEARFVTPAVLHVVAQDSQRELARCELVQYRMPMNLDVAPGSFAQGSPIALDAWDGSSSVGWYRMHTWFVRAPDYAWAKVVVDYEAGGDVRVELTPAAVLVVTPKFPPSFSSAQLDVEGPDGVRFERSFGPHHRELAFESLPPGEYRISTRMFENGEEQYRERGSLDVRTGELAQFALDLVPPTVTDPVEIAGTLEIDSSWGDGALVQRVDLSRLEAPDKNYPEGRYVQLRSLAGTELARDPTGSTRWKWKAGVLPAGRYLACVEPFRSCQVFDVPPRSAPPVRIVIPERTNVRVRVVDRETRSPLTDAPLGWHSLAPPEPSGVLLLPAEWNEQESAYSFDAPLGEISIGASSAGYELVFHPVRLAPGVNDVTIELDRIARIRVVLQEGDRRVAFPDDGRVSAERTDGRTRGQGFALEADGTYVRVVSGGQHKVSVTGLSGFEPVVPQIVDAETGKEVVVTFQLVRAR